MKYAVEMNSGSIVYIPSFVKIGSGVELLWVEVHVHTAQ
jgi:hypothetical protein